MIKELKHSEVCSVAGGDRLLNAINFVKKVCRRMVPHRRLVSDVVVDGYPAPNAEAELRTWAKEYMAMQDRTEPGGSHWDYGTGVI